MFPLLEGIGASSPNQGEETKEKVPPNRPRCSEQQQALGTEQVLRLSLGFKGDRQDVDVLNPGVVQPV